MTTARGKTAIAGGEKESREERRECVSDGCTLPEMRACEIGNVEVAHSILPP